MVAPMRVPDDNPGENGTVRVSVGDAAQLLGVTVSSVHDLIEQGVLPAERRGNEWDVLLPKILLRSEQPQTHSAVPTATMISNQTHASRPSHTTSNSRPYPRLIAVLSACLLLALALPVAYFLMRSRSSPPSANQSVTAVFLGTASPTASGASPDVRVSTPLVGESQNTGITPTPIWTLLEPSETTAATLGATVLPAKAQAATSSPMAIPTIEPLFTSTTVPSIVPARVPTATLSPPTVTIIPTLSATPAAPDVLQDVVLAEAALRSGELEAIMELGNGVRSSARVRFDMGSQEQVVRFHMITEYQGAEASQTMERITVGERSWQRNAQGGWDSIAAETGIWDQLQFFLPQSNSATTPRIITKLQDIEISWYDADRDAEITLRVDKATKTPLELRRLTRATKLMLVVTYKGWNTGVNIQGPEGP